MEKISFLSAVTEVMKGMMSYDSMMVSIERCGMRSASDNKKLLRKNEKRLDEFISGIACIDNICSSDEDLTDALVLRFLHNMQFLSDVEEARIDISGLGDELSFWRKAMLFKTPKGYVPKKKRSKKSHGHH